MISTDLTALAAEVNALPTEDRYVLIERSTLTIQHRSAERPDHNRFLSICLFRPDCPLDEQDIEERIAEFDERLDFHTRLMDYHAALCEATGKPSRLSAANDPVFRDWLEYVEHLNA